MESRMSYRQARMHAAEQFRQAGIVDAENDAWLLVEHFLEINRTGFLLHAGDAVPDELLPTFERAVEKRSQRIPLQQITGEQIFMGLPFRVTEDVLCPRQDTETLVEEAEKQMLPGMKILDLCTGSGCIAVSLKAYAMQREELSDVTLTASDLSERALALAEENARTNGTQILFVRSDLFAQINEKYDMIVSNPPYIPTGEIDHLMPEVAEHEPLMALDGREDGLYFYRTIVAQSREYLSERGKLLFEIGYDQGKDVSEMLIYEGFRNVRVIRDLAHNDRVVIGEL